MESICYYYCYVIIMFLLCYYYVIIDLMYVVPALSNTGMWI